MRITTSVVVEFWAFIEGTKPNIESGLELCERRKNCLRINNSYILSGTVKMKMKSNPSGRSDSLYQAVLGNDVLLFVVLEFVLIYKMAWNLSFFVFYFIIFLY